MKWQPFIFLMIVSLASCSKTPDYVISENDMAMLLADIHEADAVVTFDKQHYKEDSTKEVLRESIFAKHGVSEEQFDTSLIWYGHNLDVYTEVYDNVVKILKDRQKRIIAEAKGAGEKMTLSGDSVDIWASTPHIIFDRKRLGKDAQIAFSLPADNNSKAGDRYEWRFILYNATKEGNALIAVDYDDGSSEYHSQNIKPDETAKLTLQSDSTLNVTRVYGYLIYKMEEEDAVFTDSIMLYRSRLNSDRYNFHNFQRKVKNVR